MSTNHAAVAALPTTAPANKTLLRNLLVARVPYVLADTDNPTDLVAVDPSTGAAIVDITFLGRLFHYDATDLTTANDGVSCLVSIEGRRYKLANATDVAVWGVLSRTPTAPPGSPALGDAYLVPSGATGAWSGHGNAVAVKTARGWEFVTFGIGRLLYVEDIDTYYRRNAGGVWTAGLGASALAADSVTLQNVLGADASFMIKVENQTTNAPPGSPSPPTAYIVGPSPTGSWAGNAGKLAMCLSGSTFTIIAAAAGDQVYDKARNAVFQFDGTAWAATNGVLAATARATIATYLSFATPIPLDDSIPQINEGTEVISLHYTPKSATNKLRVRFKADISTNSSAPGHGIASLFQDAIANAIKATTVYFGAASSMVQISLDHEYVPGTTSPIILSVRLGTSDPSATVFQNGTGSTRLFGGADSMSLTVDEIIA